MAVQLQHALYPIDISVTLDHSKSNIGEAVRVLMIRVGRCRRRRRRLATAAVNWRLHMIIERRVENCLRLLRLARFTWCLFREHPANHPLTLPKERSM